MCSLLACGSYYYIWAILLPKWKSYSLRQELITLDDGAQTHQLRKVPNAQIAEWDASHDVAGRPVGSSLSEVPSQEQRVAGVLDQDEKLDAKQPYVYQRDGDHV